MAIASGVGGGISRGFFFLILIGGGGVELCGEEDRFGAEGVESGQNELGL